MEGGEEELAALTSRRPGRHPLRVECEFGDAEGVLGGMMVMVPDLAD